MSIIERIKSLFTNKDETRETVKQLADSFQEMKESGAKDPIDTTVAKMVEMINETEDPTTAKKLLVAALEEENMPNRIPEKFAVKLSEMDEIPDAVIPNAIKESETEVPDEIITTIIEKGDVGTHERLELINNVDDEDIIKEQIKNEFDILYNSVEDKRDNEIASRIKDIKEVLIKNNTDMNVDLMVVKVLAKKMADNIYDDSKKGTMFGPLSQAMPIEKMFEKNIVKAVDTEFRKIEKEKGIKEGRFSEEFFRAQILNEIGKIIGYKYQEKRVFIIPQSEAMKKLNDKESQVLIDAIKTTCGKELTGNDELEIREEIKGIIRNKEIKEMMLVEKIKELPDKDNNIDFFSSLLENEETLRTLKLLEKTGTLNQLNEIEGEKREKTIGLINNALENRKNKDIEKTTERNTISETTTRKAEETNNINTEKTNDEGEER